MQHLFDPSFTLATLDPFGLDAEDMRDEGLTPNRSLVDTARAFHAWRDRHPVGHSWGDCRTDDMPRAHAGSL